MHYVGNTIAGVESKEGVAASQRRTQELECSVREVVKKLYEEGKCPSVKRVKTLLGKCTLRNWIAISSAIKAAKRDLNAASSASR